MKLNQKTIWTIIILSAIALTGIGWLQVHLLMNSARQKEEAFRRSVSAALVTVTQRLETGETVGQFLMTSIKTLGTKKHTVAVLGMPEKETISAGSARREKFEVETSSPEAGSSGTVTAGSIPLRIKGNKIQYTVPKPERVRLRAFDIKGNLDTMLVDAEKLPGVYEVAIDTFRFGSSEHTFQYSADSLSMILNVTHGSSGEAVARNLPFVERDKAIRRVFDKLLVSEGLPIERRVNPSQLDSVIGVTLRESGIQLPYSYGVISARNDSLRMARSPGDAAELKNSEFKAPLFPTDVFAEKNDLVLYFPGRRMFLFKQIAPMIAATFLFVAMIAFGFGYTIRTIIRQRRMAAYMVDFINNMTHEFKTPISTIALASEAIARPDVLTDTGKIARYNAVIQDENTRMRHQVDKILQMAVLEDGDYELARAPVDVHEIIKTAIGNIALRVESKQGTITGELNASYPLISGDALHIANIIHNLLDNADKYSPDGPIIRVSSENVNGALIVRVSDNGIGMNAEDAGRAFDKYFRVPTGNKHDVKGFGLGLSYVRLMMGAHGGAVRLLSEPGKGTVVELSFPQSPKTTRTDGKAV